MTEITSSSNRHLDEAFDGLTKINVIPAWLNEIYFENFLRQEKCDDSLKVKNLKVQKCGGDGESYIGIMFRVGVHFTDATSPELIQFRSLIVKVMSDHNFAVEVFGKEGFAVQTKEMEMYQRFVPAAKKILATVNEDTNIFPAAAAIDNELEVIVLEDLAEAKYILADRFTGLDMKHILMVVRKLARMHAASVVIHQKDPTAYRNFDAGMFSSKYSVCNEMFESFCKAFVDELTAWEGFEYYAEKVSKLRPSMVKNAIKCFEHVDGDFLVLTHGDLWINNIMFKYNEQGEPVDCVLIDLQLVSHASPAVDLLVKRLQLSIEQKFNVCLILPVFLLLVHDC